MTPLSRQPSTTAMPLRCVRGVCDYYGTFYSAHNQQSIYTFTDCRMDVFVYDDARLCAQRRKTPSSSSYTIMEQYVIWLHQFNLIHRVFYVLWVSAWADRRKRIYKKKKQTTHRSADLSWCWLELDAYSRYDTERVMFVLTHSMSMSTYTHALAFIYSMKSCGKTTSDTIK